MFQDLFDTPALPGLDYREDAVSAGEEAALIAGVNASDLTPFRFQGWIGKRLTASFGWRYDFDDASSRETEPIPEWLGPLRVRAAEYAGLAPDELIQALVIRYDPGAGIGWHRDRPVFEQVIGISLGNPATLRLRRRRAGGGFDRFAAPLAPRSIYHLSGEARHSWEHSIAPLEVPRWSITFCSMSERGRRTG